MKGEVALGLGRQTAVVTVIGIGLGFLSPPFLERERGIGHHDVKLHELIVLDQPGIPQRVAPLDAEVVHAVQEHVHPAKGVGGAIALLAEQRKVALIGLTTHFDEQ